MRQTDKPLAFLGEFSPPEDDIVVLGVVAKARGLRGEVMFHPLSREPETFARYRAVRIGDGQGHFSRPVAVAGSRLVQNAVVFRLDGVENRDQAERLIGCAVAVDAHDLPALAEDEYYWRELVGLNVYDADMAYIGKVEALLHNGAHDVLVVKDGKSREVLLPMVKEIIGQRLVAAKPALVVAPIAGLVDANRDVA